MKQDRICGASCLNTTSDVTRSLNWVQEPRHSFSPKGRFSSAKTNTFCQYLTEIKFTMIQARLKPWTKRGCENYVSVALQIQNERATKCFILIRHNGGTLNLGLLTTFQLIDPLHKWRLNTWYTLASHSCFKTKESSLECELRMDQYCYSN